jgi:hypothetical protein
VPSHDPAIKLQNLCLQHPQLRSQRCQTATRKLRQPLVARIGDHIKQFFDTVASDRGDDPELGKVSADRGRAPARTPAPPLKG